MVAGARPGDIRVRPVTERMDAALERLRQRFPMRIPKAFYLGPDDWTEFMAGDPPMVRTLFNRKPVEQPSFKGVAVRASKNVAPRSSRLYDNTNTGRELPE